MRAFVKAALHGMNDIMDDPNAAATDFVKFVPEWKGKEDQVKEAFTYYDKRSIRARRCSARSIPSGSPSCRTSICQAGIIQKKTPVEDLFTNQFIK